MDAFGSVRRRIERLLQPADVATVSAPVGSNAILLLSGSRSSDSLSVSVLTQDSSENDPVAVVQQFSAAIAAGNFASAREVVTPNMRGAFDSLLGSPDSSRVRSEAGTISDLSVISRTEETALVTGTRQSGGTGLQPVEFVLRRNALSGRWNLTAF